MRNQFFLNFIVWTGFLTCSSSVILTGRGEGYIKQGVFKEFAGNAETEMPPSKLAKLSQNSEEFLKCYSLI